MRRVDCWSQVWESLKYTIMDVEDRPMVPTVLAVFQGGWVSREDVEVEGGEKYRSLILGSSPNQVTACQHFPFFNSNKNMSNEIPKAKALPPAINADELLAKCQKLLNELEECHKFLAEQKKDHVVEIRQFRNSVASEFKSLERVRSVCSQIYHLY
jgi:hypothetical protein